MGVQGERPCKPSVFCQFRHFLPAVICPNQRIALRSNDAILTVGQSIRVRLSAPHEVTIRGAFELKAPPTKLKQIKRWLVCTRLYNKTANTEESKGGQYGRS